MIEMTERTIGVWFVELPGMDFMGHLETLKDDPKFNYLFTYRFRYYDPRRPDNAPFSGIDKKNWYTVKMGPRSKEEALSDIRQITQKLASTSGGKLYEVLMTEAGYDEFLERFMEQPWAHMRKLKKEDFKGEFN